MEYSESDNLRLVAENAVLKQQLTEQRVKEAMNERVSEPGTSFFERIQAEKDAAHQQAIQGLQEELKKAKEKAELMRASRDAWRNKAEVQDTALREAQARLVLLDAQNLVIDGLRRDNDRLQAEVDRLIQISKGEAISHFLEQGYVVLTQERADHQQAERDSWQKQAEIQACSWGAAQAQVERLILDKASWESTRNRLQAEVAGWDAKWHHERLARFHYEEIAKLYGEQRDTLSQQLAEQRAAMDGLVEALKAVLEHGVTHAVGCSHLEPTCSCHRSQAKAALAAMAKIEAKYNNFHDEGIHV